MATSLLQPRAIQLVTPFLVISPVSLSSYSTFLCIAAGWVVVDKNIHTTGGKQIQRMCHFNLDPIVKRAQFLYIPVPA
jgi:hypothetical protein